jgi:nucleosome assembly protein 1-like 1
MSGGKKGGNQQQKGNQEQFKFDFGAPVLVNSQGQSQQQGGAVKFDFNAVQGGLMQAVSGKLGGLIGQSSGYLESLPKPVQNRIKALRKLHEKRSDLEKDFKKELAELEKKYSALYNPLYERRKEIVIGASEPTAEELQPTEAEKEGEQKTEQTTEQKTEQKQEDVKGVPSFWLEALKHSDEFGDFITDRDEDALQHLYEIKASPYEKEGVSNQSFSLEFYFNPNDFFENDVIKKTYFLVDKEFGTTMFDKVESTDIKWKQGKNLTVKLVTKQQGGNKRGGRGGKGGRGGRGGAQQPVKTITVEEPCQSFFNFFNPTAGMEDADPEELQAILEDDYELGLMVKDEIIPNAVLWFTGEAAELYGGMFGEDFDEDEEDFEDEDDDEEEEEEEEEAPRGRGGARPRGGRGGRGARIGEVAEDYKSDEDPDFEPDQQQQGQQPECKQQ